MIILLGDVRLGPLGWHVACDKSPQILLLRDYKSSNVLQGTRGSLRDVYITEGKTEAQRGEVMCLRSHSHAWSQSPDPNPDLAHLLRQPAPWTFLSSHVLALWLVSNPRPPAHGSSCRVTDVWAHEALPDPAPSNSGNIRCACKIGIFFHFSFCFKNWF